MHFFVKKNSFTIYIYKKHANLFGFWKIVFFGSKKSRFGENNHTGKWHKSWFGKKVTSDRGTFCMFSVFFLNPKPENGENTHAYQCSFLKSEILVYLFKKGICQNSGGSGNNPLQNISEKRKKGPNLGFRPVAAEGKFREMTTFGQKFMLCAWIIHYFIFSKKCVFWPLVWLLGGLGVPHLGHH